MYNILNGLMISIIHFTNKMPALNMFTGNVGIYFIMDVLMDSVVIIIYTVAGTMFPLDEDYRLTNEYPFLRLVPLGETWRSYDTM